MCASTIPADDKSSKPPSTLIELEKAFDRVEIELEFAEMLRRTEARMAEDNALLERICDEKLELMSNICWAAVSMPANTPEELKIKSRMLQTYCVTGDNDLVHDLASSVCVDIQRAERKSET